MENFADERQWLTCKVKSAVFEGAGGPEMLGKILEGFLDWAEAE